MRWPSLFTTPRAIAGRSNTTWMTQLRSPRRTTDAARSRHVPPDVVTSCRLVAPDLWATAGASTVGFDLDETVSTHRCVPYAIRHQHRRSRGERDHAVQSTWLALCAIRNQIPGMPSVDLQVIPYLVIHVIPWLAVDVLPGLCRGASAGGSMMSRICAARCWAEGLPSPTAMTTCCWPRRSRTSHTCPAGPPRLLVEPWSISTVSGALRSGC
jgi:hypothetical protein